MCLLLKIETQDGAISFAAAHPSFRPCRRVVRHLFFELFVAFLMNTINICTEEASQRVIFNALRPFFGLNANAFPRDRSIDIDWNGRCTNSSTFFLIRRREMCKRKCTVVPMGENCRERNDEIGI